MASRPNNIPSDWEARRDEVLRPMLDRWEEAWVQRGEDLSPEELCPGGPSEVWDALAEDIRYLKQFPDVPSPSPTDDEKDPARFAADQFEGIEFVNEGGQGVVIRARDRRLGRDVAVKLPRQSKRTDHQRLEKEARITSGLEHPGVMPVYGFGHDAHGHPYYAMRYMPKKRTFEDAIRESRALPDEQSRTAAFHDLLRDFAVICRTIDYAHHRRVVHRDVKPVNIMSGEYGELFVADWGLAKSLVPRDGAGDDNGDEGDDGDDGDDAQTRKIELSDLEQSSATAIVGTLGYVSPEQARMGGVVGPASDIYSLGATLYHVLTGVAPFDNESVPTLLAKIQRGEFRRPREVDPAIPKPLEAICLKAMALDPADRYPSARALGDDVKNWLDDRPVSAWLDPWLVRVRRWAKSHRAAVAGAAAALAVAFVSLIVSSTLLAEKNVKLAEMNVELEEKNFELAKQNVELEQKNVALRRPRYANEIALARELFAGGSRDAALDVLDATDVDLRGIEWSRMRHAYGPPRELPLREVFTTLKNNRPTAWAISPDGSRLAVANLDPWKLLHWQVRVLELPSGEEVHREIVNGRVVEIGFDATGERMAAAVQRPLPGFEGVRTMIEMAAKEGQAFVPWTPGQLPRDVDFTSWKKGNRERVDPLVDEVRAQFGVGPSRREDWERADPLTRDEFVKEFRDAGSLPVEFFPHDERLRMLEENERLPNGRLPVGTVYKITLPPTEAADDPPRGAGDVLVSTDSRILKAVASGDRQLVATLHADATIRMWTTSGQPYGSIPLRAAGVQAVHRFPDGKVVELGDAAAVEVVGLAFLPDDRTLAWVTDGSAWSAQEAASAGGVWTHTFDVPEHRAFVPSTEPVDSPGHVVAKVKLSRDRSTVVTLEHNPNDGPRTLVRAWDAATGAERCCVKLDRVSTDAHVAVNEDGSLLAYTEPGELVHVVDASNGQRIWSAVGFVGPIAFGPGKRDLAACRPPSTRDGMSVRVFAIDGEDAVAAKLPAPELDDSPAEAEPGTEAQPAFLAALSRVPTRLSFDPRTNSFFGVASKAGKEGVVLREYAVGPGEESYGRALLTTIGQERRGSYWRIDAGLSLVAFSPNRSLAVTVDTYHSIMGDDSTGPLARVHDTTDWRVVAILRGHSQTITNVAFSRDGHRIATVGREGEANVWDAATGTLLWTFRDPKAPEGGFEFVAFDEDDTTLIAGSREGITRWRPPRE